MLTEAKDSSTLFQLIIKNCKLEDSGQYIAKIKNSMGEATTQTKFNVLYGPKFVKNLNNEYLVKEHDTAKISAEIVANPKADVSWAKEINNDIVPISQNERIKLEQQQNISSLILKDSQLSDSGEYMCIAKNKINEVQSKTKLMVAIPPAFKLQPESNKEVELDQNIDIKCVVRGLPLPKLKLIDTKNQIEKISKDDEIIIQESVLSETEIEYTFTFVSIKPDSPSSYECKAINQIGEATSKFSLNIIRKPEFIKKLDELISLQEKSEIILNAVVFASPDATISWFKDNNKLSASKRIQIIDDKSKIQGPKSYSLKIPAPTKEDAGSYEIVAINKLGEARCASIVNIEFGPIIVKDLKSQEKGIDGKEFIFECSFKANPKPEIKW